MYLARAVITIGFEKAPAECLASLAKRYHGPPPLAEGIAVWRAGAAV